MYGGFCFCFSAVAGGGAAVRMGDYNRMRFDEKSVIIWIGASGTR